VLALVLILHGTAPALYPEPRYLYAYRHIALTKYFELHGSARRSIDIYDNWSGFFGAAAYVSKVTGLDPMGFANWAQLFFAGAGALAVRFTLRGFTSNVRTIALATWIFVLADWVGQNYFSPQALGFVLSVTAIGIAVRWLPRRRIRRSWPGLEGLRRRLAAPVARVVGTRVAPEEPAVAPVDTRAQGAAAVLVAILTAVVAVSHPLSPIILTLWLLALALIGRRHLWLLTAFAAIMTVGWIVLAHSWLSVHVQLLSDVGQAGANSSGTSGTHPGSALHRLVALDARVLSIGVWLAAICAGWMRLRAGYRDATLGLLAVAPFILVLGQSYGGEAIYRVFLFSLPWCCFLIAWMLLGPGERPSWRRRGLTIAALAVLPCLSLVAYFGLERINIVQPQDVAASTWFARHAAPGSLLAGVADGTPGALTANYDQFSSPWGSWGATIIGGDPTLTGRELTVDDVPEAIAYLRSFVPRDIYIVLSPSQEANAEMYGLAPDGAVARFSQILADQPEFETVFRQGNVSVLKLRAETAPGSGVGVG
jgi:hypothetical protein